MKFKMLSVGKVKTDGCYNFYLLYNLIKLNLWRVKLLTKQ